MKEEYILYLDESEKNKTKKFAIAGLAIKQSDIPKLEEEILKVKKLIWDEDYINANSPILHSTEFENVYSRRKIEQHASFAIEPYKFLAQKSPEEIEEIYKQVYGRLSYIVRTLDITIFSCIIDVKQLSDLFFLDEKHNGVHMIDDKYNIALQKIIENYTHFLNYKDGFGNVLYESRNNIGENSPKSPDIKLINNFHQIHANNRGIIYINNKIIQERNRVFSTSSKADNIAGLQLADFVAYNILKYYSIRQNPKQVTDFMKQIHRYSYNGGHSLEEKDQRSFWGMRILPSYPMLHSLEISNKQLINANNNLKKERNALKKEIQKLKSQIENLQIELDKEKLCSEIAATTIGLEDENK